MTGAKKNRRSPKQLAAAGVKLAQSVADQKIAIEKAVVSGITTVGDDLFGQSKGWAVAKAIINTYEGFTQALAAPYPLDLVLPEIVLAEGLAEVAKIEGVGFDDPRNDFAARVGGAKWALDMVNNFEAGASMGFSRAIMNTTNNSNVFSNSEYLMRTTRHMFVDGRLANPPLRRNNKLVRSCASSRDDAGVTAHAGLEMSTLYSLRVLPNFDPMIGPSVWTDASYTLDVTQLPSIQIATEREDIPLTTAVSDLSLTLMNADNFWDSIFNSNDIIGTYHGAGSTLRAPLTHYGAILLCQKSTRASNWEVLFFGYINPSSITFHRLDKTVSFTAYAPGTLLEKGNAERVNRISTYVAARPFWLPFQLFYPAVLPGSSVPGEFWWQLNGGYQVNILPGDQFQVIQTPPAWVENQPVTTLLDTVFNITAVTISGLGLYFQTAEPMPLLLDADTAKMLLLNPWLRSQPWETIVQLLIDEVNAALGALGAPDVIGVGLHGLHFSSNSVVSLSRNKSTSRISRRRLPA